MEPKDKLDEDKAPIKKRILGLIVFFGSLAAIPISFFLIIDYRMSRPNPDAKDHPTKQSIDSVMDDPNVSDFYKALNLVRGLEESVYELNDQEMELLLSQIGEYSEPWPSIEIEYPFISMASSNSDFRINIELIELGFDARRVGTVKYPEKEDHKRGSLLHGIVSSNDAKFLSVADIADYAQFLLSAGVDPSHQSTYDGTAIEMVLRKGTLNMVEAFYQAGIFDHATSQGISRTELLKLANENILSDRSEIIGFLQINLKDEQATPHSAN